MEHNPKAYLFDIQESCEQIQRFTSGMTLEEFQNNLVVKAAVERKFIIIGEALTRLRKENPAIINKISDSEKIIGFRNILVHGYSVIDDATVWSAIQTGLPTLLKEVTILLQSGSLI
jgi:uncharacterized protein with HEPN domain